MNMKFESMELGLYQTNCYIVWDEQTRDCVLIDPGDEPQRIALRLQQLELTPQAILLTHAHFDHIGAVPSLRGAFGCRLLVCREDLNLPNPVPTVSLEGAELYGEGDTVEVGALRFAVLHTPGHTPGSVCLRSGNCLFTGDTLFRGSCGRTDLPMGDWEQMAASLRRLGGIEEDLYVYPGHGDATTLAREKRTNPFLREAMRR